MPSLSVKKRDNHKAYYGLVRPADDPIWQSIFPPNGYGCRCWVKQLTKRQAEAIMFQQAKDVSNGKSEPFELEMETVQNPRTGEAMQTPKGVHFSFAHNHDRLTALLKLAEDKHNLAFSLDIEKELKPFMITYAENTGNVQIVDFGGIVYRESEKLRLEKELDGNTPSHYEGIVGDE